MDETMNLNGMGIGVAQPTVTAVAVDSPVENSNNELQEVTANIPEDSSVSTPTPVIEEKTTSLEANNQVDFGEDLDMIKELRAEEAALRNKESIFSNMDFGPLKKYLENDDVTDISYSNGGQLWLKTLSKGVYRVQEDDINDALIEKIAFQCSNIMGKTFNMAHPFLDSESAELRMNFIHDSIARNGIAVVFRKTPAKIRLEKDKLMKENYVSLSIHDFLIKAVQGHCNIIMCGETGSGKTEFLKYLASHTFENEKIVTVEDTLELHLDRIYPHRDIVAMKTNNVASYSDVLVTCMRQNPIWILLSEVRSAEAVTAVRNSISSGHFILSTIHADKAANIPYRLYSLLESNIDVEQFLNTIYRYVQIGVFLRGRFDPKQGRFVREIGEVSEFYVNDNNECITNTIYQKTIKGDVTYKPISEHLLDYLEGQGIDMSSIREANGDLEKVQNYSEDETKEENKVEEVVKTEESTDKKEVDEVVAPVVATPPITEEIKPITAVVEEVKPIPITETVEVKPIDNIQTDNLINEVVNGGVEEKVVEVEPVVAPIPITEEIKPITPVVEEVKPVPIIEAVEVKPITPIIEAKVVPITQEVIQPITATENVTPITATPIIETAANQISVTPIVEPVATPIAPVQNTSETAGTDSSSQPVNFTPINVTNIQ